MPETKTEVKCQHCGFNEPDQYFVTITGKMVNAKTKEIIPKELTFCNYLCLLAWLLDDLIKSPLSRVSDEWKPVLQQFHDYLETL